MLGTAHGEYLRRQVERHRRGVPDGVPDGRRRCWGHMVWQGHVKVEQGERR